MGPTPARAAVSQHVPPSHGRARAEGSGAVIMWTWDACVPGRGGGGASDDEQRARQIAEDWMRAHRAPTATVEQVLLVLGAASLLTRYERTGIMLAARFHSNGCITWAPSQTGAAQQAAP